MTRMFLMTLQLKSLIRLLRNGKAHRFIYSTLKMFDLERGCQLSIYLCPG